MITGRFSRVAQVPAINDWRRVKSDSDWTPSARLHNSYEAKTPELIGIIESTGEARPLKKPGKPC